MGSKIHNLTSYTPEKSIGGGSSSSVLELAVAVCQLAFSEHGKPVKLSHLVAVTSGPDRLAPSLGQELRRELSLPDCLTIDMVQGCSGGASSLILASQLAARSGACVMVVVADAAAGSVSPKSPMRSVLRDGAFFCLVSNTPNDDSIGLIDHFSRQYVELTDIVEIPIGHRAKELIRTHPNIADLVADPAGTLGFHVNNALVLRMLRKSTQVIHDIRAISGEADYVISHHPSSRISKVLRKNVFFEKSVFVDMSEEGNCGAATTGIALCKVKGEIAGKKVLIGGFGTGGALACGIWQF